MRVASTRFCSLALLLLGCASDDGGAMGDEAVAGTASDAPSSPGSTPGSVSVSETRSPPSAPHDMSAGEPGAPPSLPSQPSQPATDGPPGVLATHPAADPTQAVAPAETNSEGGAGAAPLGGSGGQPSSGGTAAAGVAGAPSGGAPGGHSPIAGGGGGVGAGGNSAGSAGASMGPTDFCDPSEFSRVVRVDARGAGDFERVQDAVDSLSGSDSALVQIAPGVYKEKLQIANRSFITFCGESAETTVLTYDLNNEAAGGTSASASTTIDADDFSAVNITFENSRPIGSGQAVAILLRGERQQFLDCRFISFQDTLYVHHGTQYFRNCYVQGTVDYVFGGSAAVLEDCTMYNAGGGSAVTAPNTDLSQPYGIVFFRGELTAARDLGADSVALGRPWGPDGAATFIDTVLGAHVKKVGWVEMSGNSPSNARFAEYHTTGPGASPGTRVQGSEQLTDEEAARYTLENILGGWTPTFSTR